MRVCRRLFGVLLLALGFVLGSGGPLVRADTSAVGPTAVVLETRTFPDSRGAGHYLLRRRGQTITALLQATRVPCPSAGSQFLFKVPDGFRPAVPVDEVVAEAEVVHVQEPAGTSASTVGLRVQVTPAGRATLIADCPRGVDVLLRHTTQLGWSTPEPMLWMAGYYRLPVGDWDPFSPYERWRGVYRLERLGSTVHAHLFARDLPLTCP